MSKILNLKDNLGELHIIKKENGYYNLIRKNNRNKIVNIIDHIQFFNSNNECKLIPIDDKILKEIEHRVEINNNYSSYFVFHDKIDEINDDYVNQEKSQEEHQFTSTGIKFWRHQEKMLNYKKGDSYTVVSTHISPEGSCNLKCPYCSVTYRKNTNRIKLEVIKDYVLKLKSRGLKAVILTGGGEPTLYKHFNELVRWLKDQNLSIALITNGTNSELVDDDVWKLFSWIRVSINLFSGWESRINIPIKFLSQDCILGMSHVFTVEHEKIETTETLEYFNKISTLADKLNAKYIRVLPNCLLEQETLIRVHKGLDKLFTQLKDTRFFHQYKFHEAPKSSVCHQSYFRPYLSEEPFWKTGEPGTVYPCDSVVLNNSVTYFEQKYQLCSANDVLDYIDKKINHKFIACNDCKGCVFTNNINAIDDFINNKIDRFSEFTSPIQHEEFI